MPSVTAPVSSASVAPPHARSTPKMRAGEPGDMAGVSTESRNAAQVSPKRCCRPTGQGECARSTRSYSWCVRDRPGRKGASVPALGSVGGARKDCASAAQPSPLAAPCGEAGHPKPPGIRRSSPSAASSVRRLAFMLTRGGGRLCSRETSVSLRNALTGCRPCTRRSQGVSCRAGWGATWSVSPDT